MPAKYWLMKTEPESFSIADLQAAPKQTTCWDGVRNYQARNFMRAMQVGDHLLFYHSSADPPAVVGTATVVREAYPDPTAWRKGDHHFDPKASPENPIWDMVDIRFEHKFDVPLALDALRREKSLTGMELLRKGSRLSVQPVTKAQFDTALKLAERVAATEQVAGAKPRRRTPQRKPAGKHR
jgi:predicted RNA-binding protein with PUA-like domain